MAQSIDLNRDPYADGTVAPPPPRPEPEVRRLPETKTFLATSEFWVLVGAAVAVFFAAYAMDDITDATSWRYGVYLAIGYMISRGLAKAGSQRTYDEHWRYDR